MVEKNCARCVLSLVLTEHLGQVCNEAPSKAKLKIRKSKYISFSKLVDFDLISWFHLFFCNLFNFLAI